MREAQKTVLELGLGSRLFESSDDENIAPPRFIDQAVVVWRNATRIMKSGCLDYPNPRTVAQQKFGLTASRNMPVEARSERVQFNVSPYLYPPPYNPEELERTIPIIHRRRAMTAGEVRMRMDEARAEREANRRSGLRYPTPAEVAEIERRFRNPELEHAMEVARQEIMRRYWPRNVTLEPQYFERMTRLISEPAPPGFREAMRAAAGDIEEEENLR